MLFAKLSLCCVASGEPHGHEATHLNLPESKELCNGAAVSLKHAALLAFVTLLGYSGETRLEKRDNAPLKPQVLTLCFGRHFCNFARFGSHCSYDG